MDYIQITGPMITRQSGIKLTKSQYMKVFDSGAFKVSKWPTTRVQWIIFQEYASLFISVTVSSHWLSLNTSGRRGCTLVEAWRTQVFKGRRNPICVFAAPHMSQRLSLEQMKLKALSHRGVWPFVPDVSNNLRNTTTQSSVLLQCLMFTLGCSLATSPGMTAK